VMMKTFNVDERHLVEIKYIVVLDTNGLVEICGYKLLSD